MGNPASELGTQHDIWNRWRDRCGERHVTQGPGIVPVTQPSLAPPGGIFVSPVSSEGTAPAASAAAPTLPCQSSHKCCKHEDVPDVIRAAEQRLSMKRQLKSWHAGSARDIKACMTLRMNVEALVDAFGLERIGFLTLTLPDHLDWWSNDDWKEARRRFKSLNDGYLRRMGFSNYISVVEPQASGRIHWHLVLVLLEDIRTGVAFDEFDRGNYQSAGKYLRSLWKDLRRILPRYGFGRHELMPIRKDKEAMAHYVAKYLNKGRVAEMSGIVDGRKMTRRRRVRYGGKGWRRATQEWTFVEGPARDYRRDLKSLAAQCGWKSFEDPKELFGSRWAYQVQMMMYAMPGD